MGEVWLGRDIRLDRQVAIKMIRSEVANDPVYIERFEREAKAVARLSHPNIVHIYSFGEEDGTIYFAMEWIDGNSLAHRIRERGQMDRAKAVKMVQETAQALSYACTMGIIHRDIKPGNIMLDSADRVKVADFGLAKLADQESQMTATGAPMGSPSYMSPEACRGESLDHRADIYSLGVTFYQMLQGELPFSASTPMSVMFKQVSEPLPEPVNLRFLENGTWMNVLRKMTAKELRDRYASYDELLLDLDKLALGSTFSGNSPTPVQGLRETPRAFETVPGNLSALSSSKPYFTMEVVEEDKSDKHYVYMAVAALLLIFGGFYAYSHMRSGAAPKMPTESPVAAAVTPAFDSGSNIEENASTSVLPPVTAAKQPGNKVAAEASTPEAIATPRPQLSQPTINLPGQDIPSPPPIAPVVSPGSNYAELIENLSPQAAVALKNYDFNSVEKILAETLNDKKLQTSSRPVLESLQRELGNLTNFRETIVAGASRNPGLTHMQGSQGDLSLIGGSSTGLKFQSTGGVVEIPFSSIPPAQMVLMGAPFNDRLSYRTKADTFVMLWPSVRNSLPRPGEGPPATPPQPQVAAASNVQQGPQMAEPQARKNIAGPAQTDMPQRRPPDEQMRGPAEMRPPPPPPGQNPGFGPRGGPPPEQSRGAPRQQPQGGIQPGGFSLNAEPTP
jgi:hypothetical protein